MNTVILDTNVLVSAAIYFVRVHKKNIAKTKNSKIEVMPPAAKLINAVFAGRIKALVTPYLLDEYIRKLNLESYPDVKGFMPPNWLADFLKSPHIRQVNKEPELKPEIEEYLDKTDGKDIPIARAAIRYGIPIITRNVRHFIKNEKYAVIINLKNVESELPEIARAMECCPNGCCPGKRYCRNQGSGRK